VPEDDVVLLSAPELQAANTANPKKTKINCFMCLCLLFFWPHGIRHNPDSYRDYGSFHMQVSLILQEYCMPLPKSND
jgi:hypothetical protein